MRVCPAPPNAHSPARVEPATHLTGNTSGDDDNLSTSQRVLEAIVVLCVASRNGGGVDVRDVGGDSCSLEGLVRSTVTVEYCY